MRIANWFVSIPVLCGCCLSLMLLQSALGQPEKKTDRPNSDRPNPQFQGGGMARFTPGLERLMRVLTDEQKTSLRESMEAEREKTREIESKLRDARKDIFEAGLVDKFDEKAVREKALAAAKLEAELTVVRARAFSKMRPQLSAEQLEKMRDFQPAGGPESASPAPARKRPDIRRDENGLPVKKDQPTAKKEDDRLPAPK